MSANNGAPPWEDAPEWAEWRAMDYDGEWWWYENEPMEDNPGPNLMWFTSTGRTALASSPFPRPADTKERRPRALTT